MTFAYTIIHLVMIINFSSKCSANIFNWVKFCRGCILSHDAIPEIVKAQKITVWLSKIAFVSIHPVKLLDTLGISLNSRIYSQLSITIDSSLSSRCFINIFHWVNSFKFLFGMKTINRTLWQIWRIMGRSRSNYCSQNKTTVNINRSMFFESIMRNIILDCPV